MLINYVVLAIALLTLILGAFFFVWFTAKPVKRAPSPVPPAPVVVTQTESPLGEFTVGGIENGHGPISAGC